MDLKAGKGDHVETSNLIASQRDFTKKGGMKMGEKFN